MKEMEEISMSFSGSSASRVVLMEFFNVQVRDSQLAALKNFYFKVLQHIFEGTVYTKQSGLRA